MLDATINAELPSGYDRFTICPASKDEASDLANLAVIASEGLCLKIWDGLKEGEERTLDVGRRRAANSTGSFSYQNADIAIQNQNVIAAIISYPSEPEAMPPVLSEYPTVFRPLAQLAHAAGPSWYINFLATYPGSRSQGAATALLENVQTRAKLKGYSHLSLMVDQANPARSLYQKFGFLAVAEAAGQVNARATNWILMKKKID